MKTRAAVIVLLLLAMQAPRALGDCPDAFIADLSNARMPAAPPVVKDCDKDFTADLAKALVLFSKTRPAGETQQVVAQLNAAYAEAERKKGYDKLIEAVKAELAPPPSEPFNALSDVFPAATVTETTSTVSQTTGSIATSDTSGTVALTSTGDGGSDKATVSGVVALLATTTIFSLAALGLAAVLFARFVRDQAEVRKRLNDVVAKTEMDLNKALGNLLVSQVAIQEKLETKPDAADLTAVSAEVASLRGTVDQLVAKLDALPTAPPPASDQVAVEQDVLAECWKQFRASGDLSAALDSAAQESVKWDPLIRELANVVPSDLKPAFDAVVAPCREHHSLVSRINAIPALFERDSAKQKSDAEMIWRAREFADLLRSTAQSWPDPSNRLNFRFNTWVTDAFLPFADAFLQRYQRACLENRAASLQEGATLVRRILRLAAVEPIDVVLGETRFDSTLHVGKSTSTDPRFSDGVITGVVRNGFIESGQQVIRQPEVIVNRAR